MIKDSPTSRSPATAMRDLLRQLERQTITPPARPTAPPNAALLRAPSAPQSTEPSPATVGDWVLHQDPVSGDLVATHIDGTSRTVASRGDH